MNMLINCLIVGAGGALGSIARYLIGAIPPPRLFSETEDPSFGAPIYQALAAFPFPTLAINVAGSFAIGCIMGAALKPGAVPPEAMLFFKVGVCGGFTTFSTFSLETMQLMQSGHLMAAGCYACISAVACIAATFVGHWVGATLLAR